MKGMYNTCEDVSGNNKMVRMDFYAAHVKPVDDDSAAHPDKGGKLRDTAVSGGADILRQFFFNVSGK